MAGYIEAYVHNSAIGVLVELKCESESTPQTVEFKALARDIAMHIVASNPVAVSPSELDPKIRNAEIESYHPGMVNLSDDEKIDRIMKANQRINSQYCLLQQPYFKDPKVSMEEKISQVSRKIGDTISVVRFLRWDIS